MSQRPVQARGSLAPAAGVALRVATIDDVPALLAVLNPAYKRVDGHIFPGQRWDEEDARRAIEMDGSRVAVAEADGAIAGCIQVVLADRAEFGPLATAVEHQRRGIATTLIGHAEQVAHDAGYRAMRLYTIEEIGWQPFYESLGYRVVRVIPSDEIPGIAEWGAVRPFTMLEMEKPLA